MFTKQRFTEKLRNGWHVPATVLILLGLVFTIRAAYAAAPTPATSVDRPTQGVPAIKASKGARPLVGGPQLTATVTAPLAVRQARPGSVLYDQYDSAARFAESSQNFEASLDAYDDQSADDFVIPGGQTWLIDQVEVAGVYRGNGPAASVNVYIYDDGFGGIPNNPVVTRTNVIYQPGPTSGDFVIPLSAPVSLGPGTYWVSVQANEDYTPGGQWLWRKRVTTTGNQGAWRNPLGGFDPYYSFWSHCSNPFGPCYYDLVFRLDGRIAGTPVSTPTGTLPTSTAT